MTLMLIKYSSQKKNHMVKKAHLNTSLGIMMMMSLDHYVYGFLKRLDLLKNLMIKR